MKFPELELRLGFRKAVTVGALALSTVYTRADAFDHWTGANVVTNYQQGGALGALFFGVRYGNGRYVAVGEIYDEWSLIEMSSDGAQWSAQNFGRLTANLTDITFHGGTFVAVGGYGWDNTNIYTSNDGLTWTGHVINMNLRAVTYGGGLFVAVGTQLSSGLLTNYNIATSADGITWAAQKSVDFANEANAVNDITYGAGIFVGADLNNHFYTSSDAVTWVRTTNSYANGKVSFANGLFFAPSGAGSNLISADGLNWGLVPNDTGAAFNYVAGVGGYFLAISNSRLFTSTNGTNWIQRNLQCPSNSILGRIAIGNQNVVVAGYQFNGSSTPIAFYSDPIVSLSANGQSPGHLTISGLTDSSYRIEYVTDLHANNWQPAATLTLTSDPLNWTDPQATNSSRFYRVVLLP